MCFALNHRIWRIDPRSDGRCRLKHLQEVQNDSFDVAAGNSGKGSPRVLKPLVRLIPPEDQGPLGAALDALEGATATFRRLISSWARASPKRLGPISLDCV